MSHKSALKNEVPIAFIETPHADHYAEIRLNAKQRCHFLDAQNWCRVHKVDGSSIYRIPAVYTLEKLPRGKINGAYVTFIVS